MQEILEVLFPYVVILYVIDSIVFVRIGHAIFYSHFGKRFQYGETGFRLSELSPVCRTILSARLPVCLAEHGVYLETGGMPATGDGKYQFVSYEEIVHPSVDGKTVKLADGASIAMPSSLSARRLADKAGRLASAKGPKRKKYLDEFLKEEFNTEKIDSRAAAHPNMSFCLETCCVALFVLTFGIIPLAIYTELYFRLDFMMLMLNLAAAYAATLVLSFLMHRKIYPGEIGHRAHMLIVMIVSPVSAIHAICHLTKDMYAECDYVALASRLLSKDSFRDFMRIELYMAGRKRRHAPFPDLEEFWASREKAYNTLLKNAGTSPEDILKSPEKMDESAVCYCPLCLAEYREAIEICGDCGVELEIF